MIDIFEVNMRERARFLLDYPSGIHLEDSNRSLGQLSKLSLWRARIGSSRAPSPRYVYFSTRCTLPNANVCPACRPPSVRTSSSRILQNVHLLHRPDHQTVQALALDRRARGGQVHLQTVHVGREWTGRRGGVPLSGVDGGAYE